MRLQFQVRGGRGGESPNGGRLKRMSLAGVGVWAILVVGCGLNQGFSQRPPSIPGVLPDSQVIERRGDAFKLSIIRHANSATEKALIMAAEQVAPDTSLLRKMPMSSPLLPTDPRDRWWHDSHAGTLVPFAVTGKAVMYYRQRWEALAASGKVTPVGVTLKYTAVVTPALTVDGLTTVVLRLYWGEWCSKECYWGVEHERRVYFDSAGHIVRVEGDQAPVVIMT